MFQARLQQPLDEAEPLVTNVQQCRYTCGGVKRSLIYERLVFTEWQRFDPYTLQLTTATIIGRYVGSN